VRLEPDLKLELELACRRQNIRLLLCKLFVSVTPSSYQGYTAQKYSFSNNRYNNTKLIQFEESLRTCNFHYQVNIIEKCVFK